MPLQKSWQWVGAFGPDVSLCVAWAKVGWLRRSWWAVCERSGDERSARGSGSVLHEGRDAPFSLAYEKGSPIEVTTGPMWTRKTPLRVTGTVLGRSIDLPGLMDESHGRHPRRTAWRWSAGAGVSSSGSSVLWNLVEGLHDGSPSERTVWVDGTPHEVAYQP